MIEKISLVNMPSNVKVYNKSALKGIDWISPPLNLVEIAASVLEESVDCRILDLQLCNDPIQDLINNIKEYQPEIIGLTFTTLLFEEAKYIAKILKKRFPDILLISGGSHSSIFPEEVLTKTMIDIVVFGEGDITVKEIVKQLPYAAIDGIAYKNDQGRIIKNKVRTLIPDLNKLPLPAWHLLDVEKYVTARPLARQSPAAPVMISRGCVYNCTYCSHAVFGQVCRTKSVERVIREIKYVLDLGFREICIVDDQFAKDIKKAISICDELMKNKIDVPWQIITGVRVNRVNKELFVKLKQAGCYKTAFGFESGNDKILKTIKKNATVNQARNAVKLAKKAGLETSGFFMLGLPADTVNTMRDTIKFACSLGLDYAKTTIFVPLPGTPDYIELEKRGKILTKDWTKYTYHATSSVFIHDNIQWETVYKHYKKFYRKFYLRPWYMLNRLVYSIKHKQFFTNLKVAFNMFKFEKPKIRSDVSCKY